MVKSIEDVVGEFYDAVNMAPEELEEWLQTEESRKVGWNPDGGEAVGHASGRQIVELLRKRGDAEAYGEEDVDHMRRVVSYVHRNLAQRRRLKDDSAQRVENTKWRYSLMNWGHDL